MPLALSPPRQDAHASSLPYPASGSAPSGGVHPARGLLDRPRRSSYAIRCLDHNNSLVSALPPIAVVKEAIGQQLLHTRVCHLGVKRHAAQLPGVQLAPSTVE